MRRVGWRLLVLAAVTAMVVPAVGSANTVEQSCRSVSGFGHVCVRALNYATLSGEFPSIACYTDGQRRPVCFGLANVGGEAWITSRYPGKVGATITALSGRSAPIDTTAADNTDPRTYRPSYGRTTIYDETPAVTGPQGGCLTYRAQWQVRAVASTDRYGSKQTRQLYAFDTPTMVTSTHTHTVDRTFCVAQ